jgi:hypothetical protein
MAASLACAPNDEVSKFPSTKHKSRAAACRFDLDALFAAVKEPLMAHSTLPGNGPVGPIAGDGPAAESDTTLQAGGRASVRAGLQTAD